MPLNHVVDVDRKVIFIRVSGVLTEQELVELVDAVRCHPHASCEWPALADLRGVEEIRVGNSFLRGLPCNLTPTTRRAVVACSALATGLARMYALSNDLDESLRTFREPGEALEWIGLPRDTTLPQPTSGRLDRRAAG